MTRLSKLPPGMRYYLGAEARLRRSVEDTAMSVFEGWSYEEVLTPSVDYYALFEHGMGQTEAQTAFRFSDSDGQMLSLRPDITSSVARVAATLLAERNRPLRLCYAAPVFRRQQQSHAEWRRENTQLGCELIGVSGEAADLEVLLVAAEILKDIGLADSFCITINDVGIFNGLLKLLNAQSQSHETLRRLIDTRDRGELRNFLDHNCDNKTVREALYKLTELTGKQEILGEARRVISNTDSVAALDRLGRLWEVIESLGLDGSFEIDLADVSSLDYYTGISFKVFIKGVGYRVGRGGRYDGLTANFGSSEPAVGFVLSLDSLVEVLSQSTYVNGKDEPTRSIGAGELRETFLSAVTERSKKQRIRINPNL
ncbi:MAG TPA: ATP phosphoribosyltransferase regulatory subunit [Pyrinomonadaceae bacterium]